MGDYAGKTGMERTYERVLMGQRGIQYWKKDNKNRLTEPLENGRYDTSAVAGQNMYTSLDIELQELGEKLLVHIVVAMAVDVHHLGFRHWSGFRSGCWASAGSEKHGKDEQELFHGLFGGAKVPEPRLSGNSMIALPSAGTNSSPLP